MKIGNREFEKGRTYICGILNITPDSFSDGGRFLKMDDLLYHTEEMVRDGCDLLDIGAESTRPGYVPVSSEEEIQRLIPAIRAIRPRFDIPISVDTYKAATADAVIREGADLINDIRGLHPDPDMLHVIARAKIPCILMHDGPAPSMREVTDEMRLAAAKAAEAGVSHDRVILDPGIGFGKTQDQNLMLLHRLPEMTQSGFPVLLGASRKSVIYHALGLPVEEREEATIAVSVLAALAGCLFVRVHNVKGNRRAVDMTMAVLKEGRY